MIKVSRVPTRTVVRVSIECSHRLRSAIRPRQIAAMMAGRRPEIVHAIRATIAIRSHHGEDLRNPSSGLMTTAVTMSFVASVIPWNVSVSQLENSFTGVRNENANASGNAVASTNSGAARPAARIATGTPIVAQRRPSRLRARVRGSIHSPAAKVSRSRMIARITIAIPESNAEPTSCLFSPWVRLNPRPGAPISPVITIIESPSMIVWLTARPIARRASGIWTLRRIWPSVEPRDFAASTLDGDTPRIPSDVIRIAAGIAKIRVAIVDGVAPIRKSNVIGVR